MVNRTLPKSCAECEYKRYHMFMWECGLESTDMASVDIGDPFDFVPEWCRLRDNNFRKGDTIKCSTADELVDLSMALEKEGYTTEFLYEKDGVKGYWLLIEGGKEDADKREKDL